MEAFPAAHAELAHEAAVQSIVLLKNAEHRLRCAQEVRKSVYKGCGRQGVYLSAESLHPGGECRPDLMQALQAALSARFEPEGQFEVHENDLRNRRRKRSESIPELLQDIKRLTKRSYPKPTQLLYSRFQSPPSLLL